MGEEDVDTECTTGRRRGETAIAHYPSPLTPHPSQPPEAPTSTLTEAQGSSSSSLCLMGRSAEAVEDARTAALHVFPLLPDI